MRHVDSQAELLKSIAENYRGTAREHALLQMLIEDRSLVETEHRERLEEIREEERSNLQEANRYINDLANSQPLDRSVYYFKAVAQPTHWDWSQLVASFRARGVDATTLRKVADELEKEDATLNTEAAVE